MWKTLNFQQAGITCLNVVTKHGKMGSNKQFEIHVYSLTPDF